MNPWWLLLIPALLLWARAMRREARDWEQTRAQLARLAADRGYPDAEKLRGLFP